MAVLRGTAKIGGRLVPLHHAEDGENVDTIAATLGLRVLEHSVTCEENARARRAGEDMTDNPHSGCHLPRAFPCVQVLAAILWEGTLYRCVVA